MRIFAPFPKLSATLIELFSAKHMPSHLAIRKITIKDLIEEAYSQGARQCVILGGGFDIGAYRMAEKHKDLNVYEIDRAFMHSLKVEVLNKSYGALPSNFVAISADLATSRFEDVISSTQGFDRKKKTVFVAEGVIFYLSEENVADLLQQIRNVSPVGSQFIFTALMTNKNKIRHGLRRRIGNIFLWFYGEIVGFAVDPEKMPGFLASHHYKMLTLTEKDDLKSIDGRPAIFGEKTGEYIVSAATL